MSDNCYPGTAPTATLDPFAVLWIWGANPSLATRFDTWQDAILALEHAPPATGDIHVDPEEDGRWIASKASRHPCGPRVFLVPDAVMFPRLTPA